MPSLHSWMIVPWASWSEWHDAYAFLFALDEPDRRRLGVRLGELWRTRGPLPLAVEATVTLAELALADGTDLKLSEHALRLTYAMTITRLVNGVVDTLFGFAGDGGRHLLTVENPNVGGTRQLTQTLSVTDTITTNNDGARCVRACVRAFPPRACLPADTPVGASPP